MYGQFYVTIQSVKRLGTRVWSGSEAVPGLEHRVKKEAWSRAFVYTACMRNGRQHPSTERQMKNRIRTVFVCVQRQAVQRVPAVCVVQDSTAFCFIVS